MTRFSRWYRELILPAGLLSALIIGAGMFSLPYVFSSAGFLVGLFYLCLLTVVVSLIHLFYLRIISATPGEHRFVGFSQIYLGGKAFVVSVITTLMGIILVLTIYLVLSVSFWRIIFPDASPLNGLFIFWILGTTAIFSSMKRLSVLEFLTTLAMAAIVVSIFVHGLGRLDPDRLINIDLAKAFLPYGAVLFALYGRSGVSSVVEYYRSNGFGSLLTAKAVVLGTVFPALIYVAFVVGVLSLSGNVSVDAISGLTGVSETVMKMMGLLGIMAILTSYIFLGLEAKGILKYDFGWPVPLVFLTITLLPIVFSFLFKDFIQLVSLTGGVFLAIESVMVVLIWQKIAGRKVYSYGLIFLLALGILYEALKIF